MKRLTDSTFRYYSAADTNVKRTFARIRAEQKRAAIERVEVVAVRQIKAKAK